jgi:hypothetical protein
MSEARGLGAFQTIPDPNAGQTRTPQQTSAELINLRQIADEVRGVADDIDPGEPEEQSDKPDFMRGEFDANLAEHVDAFSLAKIASELIQGIDSDLQSRKQWEKITEKAIEFLGLIYEEASGQVSAEGTISKVWHTLMLEASIQFWANAQAEFLPADGPVKVRDDNTKPTPQQQQPGIGDNGGPPLDDDQRPFQNRDEKADAFETDFNHYLTTTDKQYYRDFSRMLFSLGPIGTQFRKVYYNPLRRMAVSEWVKAENLIVSNDAVHLATAGRVTERIMMRHADVKRLQWMGHWLDQPLATPNDTPTAIEQTIGAVEGIRPGPDLPADYRHTIYECYCDLDLPGFEHTDEDEDGEPTPTGLPLPYRVSLDRDSRRILEIRRNWREEDENFDARPRYVMFGLIPGLGFYYLGYAHILGNTERALTALERETIDAGMYAIFPGFIWKKGARTNTTQIRPPPGGAVEMDIGMADDIRKVVMPIPYKDLSPNVMALAEKLEENGRKLASILEIPVGEGTANIPVGTIISMIEEGTKVTAAVHKGLHQSRTEELEMLKELIAEDPTLLTRNNKSPARQWQTEDEFDDIDLVPASDPNTPSHIHRIMRAVALGQLSQLFPGAMVTPKVIDRILKAIREPNPEELIAPPQQGPAPPSPQVVSAQARVQTAQIQAASKQAADQLDAQTSAADRASKERVAVIGEQTERMKDATDAQIDTAKQHDSTAGRAQDVAEAQAGRAHEAGQAQLDREHEMRLERERQAQPGIMPQRKF